MSQIKSAKYVTQQLLKRLDDNVTYEAIMYEVYMLQKVERGLRDADGGRIVSHEEVKQKLGRWLK